MSQRQDELIQNIEKLELQSQVALASGEDWQSIEEMRQQLERELATLQGVSYCDPIDLGVFADPNAATPIIFSKSNALILGFLLRSWEPGRVTQRLGQNMSGSLYGTISMPSAIAWNVDAMGDDAQIGHPACQYPGLSFSFAHLVKQSHWIAQCLTRHHQTHQSSSRFLPEHEKHLLLKFHDELVEVITRNWDCQVFTHQDLMLAYMTQWLADQ